MTIDEIIDLINAISQKNLNPVREMILRQTWEGQTYNRMAQKYYYKVDYLKKTRVAKLTGVEPKSSVGLEK
jgi:hypothetical protein